MENIKCDKCDREFKEEEAKQYPNKIRTYRGKLVCEECLVDMGVSPQSTDPYGVYFETRLDSL
ncbi:hypothetical protein ACFLXP_02490 [Chloroflexota bacterium]